MQCWKAESFFLRLETRHGFPLLFNTVEYPSYINQIRKRNKNIQIGMKEIKLLIFILHDTTYRKY